MSLANVVLFAVIYASGALAQFTSAVCGAGFTWSENTKGQDPCTIGSDLDASCRGLATYTYPPLNASQYYLPPQSNHSGDLTCDCNMVMYSLYMACSYCQGGEIYPWTNWEPQCTSVNTTGYGPPIAQDTVIPHWAFFDVTTTTNATWSPTVAQNIGRDPEASPTPISTNSASSVKNSNTSVPTSSSGSGGGTNVGAIVGGVIGGIVLLTIFAIGAFIFTRRRNRMRQIQQSNQQPPVTPMGYPGGYDQSNLGGGGAYMPPTTPLVKYDPSDPSTFPTQQVHDDSVAYTTQPTGPRGTYQGVPEV